MQGSCASARRCSRTSLSLRQLCAQRGGGKCRRVLPISGSSTCGRHVRWSTASERPPRVCAAILEVPGTNVNNLLSILGVTKQSLNRVLRTLIEHELVSLKIGTKDRRERHLYLTESGQSLEKQLSTAQSHRMREAYRQAGPDAVAGFKLVLEAMMDPKLQVTYKKLRVS